MEIRETLNAIEKSADELVKEFLRIDATLDERIGGLRHLMEQSLDAMIRIHDEGELSDDIEDESAKEFLNHSIALATAAVLNLAINSTLAGYTISSMRPQLMRVAGAGGLN